MKVPSTTPLLLALVGVILLFIPNNSCDSLRFMKSDPNLAEETNNLRTTWQATHYPDLIFPINGVMPELKDSPKTIIVKDQIARVTIPASFDAEANWPQCKFPVRNQGICGSCWAFATTMVMQTRFCMNGMADITPGSKFNFAPQELVSCDHANMGCNGGWTNKLFDYFSTQGLVTESCYPYTGVNNATTPTCRLSGCACPAAGKGSLQKYLTLPAKRFTTIATVQEEILLNGPIVAYMDVYNDFYNYKTGVYQAAAGQTNPGGHLITITGWGTLNGTPYWLVKNSWGSTWGEQGYFKILRGSNHCKIETYFYSASPQMTPAGCTRSAAIGKFGIENKFFLFLIPFLALFFYHF